MSFAPDQHVRHIIVSRHLTIGTHRYDEGQPRQFKKQSPESEVSIDCAHTIEIDFNLSD